MISDTCKPADSSQEPALQRGYSLKKTVTHRAYPGGLIGQLMGHLIAKGWKSRGIAVLGYPVPMLLPIPTGNTYSYRSVLSRWELVLGAIMGLMNEGYEKRRIANEAHLSAFSRGCIYLEDGSVYITDEFDWHRFIGSLERIAKRIAEVDDGPIKLERTRQGERYRLTQLGRDVWNMCKSYHPFIRERCGSQIFNPHITVALRACDKWVRILNCARMGDDLDLRLGEARFALDRMVRFIRRVCRSKRFKYLLNNSERNAAAAFMSCMRYMDALFKRHSKILILRIDLYYQPYSHYGSEGERLEYVEAADKSLEKFLRDLRERHLVPDMTGWICKRENGFRRGMHYHVLVALDGHKHCKDIAYAQKLGEYWIEHCNGSSYNNNNARQDRLEYNGMGLVHVHDQDKREGLRRAIRYMTKGNHQLKTGGGKDRNLRKGIMPKWDESAPRRGAPRKPVPDINGAFKSTFSYRRKSPRKLDASGGRWPIHEFI